MAGIRLTKEQLKVVNHRGSHIQVIACAGSGKTTSIACRVAKLIDEGAFPESIVAFTFTERAAAELKQRIYQSVESIKGADFLGRLGPMFVGTIHSYCFQLLQRYVPKYGNYDVLDEHRHIGLLSREFENLCLHELGHGRRKMQPIRDFAWTVDVIGNELIEPSALSGTTLGECYSAYVEMLDRFRFLTYSRIISQAVDALKEATIFKLVHAPLRHLIVDEYQDINPAQEKLIELLAAPPVELCVVGDDDQSIYQWRGSDVTNILNFAQRRQGSASAKLETNRRSRPGIIKAANKFAKSIPNRLEKVMKARRPDSPLQVVTWIEETPELEAQKIADTIKRLHSLGYRYQDMAILLRSVRTSGPALVEVFDEKRIPSVCGGRTGLFLQPEINLFGELIAWFVDADWKDERFGPSRPADLDNIVKGLSNHFKMRGRRISELREYLEHWKKYRLRANRPVNLVLDFYRLLNVLGTHRIDIESVEGSARFGAFARFSELLADFEHVTRRGRYMDDKGKSIFRSGRDRGKPYYQQLYNYVRYYAMDAYEDFEGEKHSVDAVDILTVHQAKGLEWPIVFLPALTKKRFPSFYSGREQDWLLPEEIFPVETRRRYEGGDREERRLFYVAMTRARDVLYLSCFDRINNRQIPSPYFVEVTARNVGVQRYTKLPLPPPPDELQEPEIPSLEISFSDIANYEECAYRYRLGKNFGFQQELATELGYGRAIHHILRRIAEKARERDKVPTARQIETLMVEEFYLPFASRPEFMRMQKSADRLVGRYLSDYADDLLRVWQTERLFQLHMPDGTLAGRADVILDEEGGRPGRLAIVDYKTATNPSLDEHYQLQMTVYAEAARREGLDVVAGYVHELKNGTRKAIDVAEEKNTDALNRVTRSFAAIRRGEFTGSPSEGKCGSCDYRLVCRHAPIPER